MFGASAVIAKPFAENNNIVRILDGQSTFRTCERLIWFPFGWVRRERDQAQNQQYNYQFLRVLRQTNIHILTPFSQTLTALSCF